MDPPTKTYTGNCHCVAFRFSLTLPTQFTPKDLHSCNCSICSRKGYLLPETPVQDFHWLEGSVGELRMYSFGGGVNGHAFCGTCGGAVLIRDGEGGIYVNLQCLEGVDIWGLESAARLADGAAYGPRFEMPGFKGELPEGGEEDGTKVYFGSCHCGAVTLALRSQSLGEVEVKEDNCSICRRNKNVCVYPDQDSLSILGEENLKEYFFGGRYTGHCFCGVCGVQVCMRVKGPDEDDMRSWSEGRRKMAEAKRSIAPVRVAVLEGVEWDDLRVERCDEGVEGYVVE